MQEIVSPLNVWKIQVLMSLLLLEAVLNIVEVVVVGVDEKG